jgi:hypothetical protein
MSLDMLMRLFPSLASRTMGVPTRTRGVLCQRPLGGGSASRTRRDGQRQRVTLPKPKRTISALEGEWQRHSGRDGKGPR